MTLRLVFAAFFFAADIFRRAGFPRPRLGPRGRICSSSETNSANKPPEIGAASVSLTVARWPNDEWATIAKVVESGGVPGVRYKADKPGTFQDAAEMERNYLRWDRPEGDYVKRDGKFLAVVPTIPLKDQPAARP